MPMNTNQVIDDFLKKILWVWLPFYALFRLIKEIANKYFK